MSHMQFDSMTEQLNNMLQDLLSKISGQEQDWNKVIEKISTEMDCKVRDTDRSSPSLKLLQTFMNSFNLNVPLLYLFHKYSNSFCIGLELSMMIMFHIKCNEKDLKKGIISFFMSFTFGVKHDLNMFLQDLPKYTSSFFLFFI